MKIAMGILSLAMSITAFGNECISVTEARAVALKNINQIREDIHLQTTYRVPWKNLRNSFNSFEFSEEQNAYIAPHVIGWDCAAGASCFIGAKISCDSEVSTYVFGD